MPKERVIIKKKRPVIQRNWEDKYKCTDYMFVSIGSEFGSGNENGKSKKIKLVPIKYHFKTSIYETYWLIWSSKDTPYKHETLVHI